jgi:hypothetical protein
MNRRISEGIDAELKLKLLDENNNALFEDSSNVTGIEIAGKFDELLSRKFK